MNWKIDAPHCFSENKFLINVPFHFHSSHFILLFGWTLADEHSNDGPCGRDCGCGCHLELTKLQLKLIYYLECQLNWMVISSRCSMDLRYNGTFSSPVMFPFRHSKCEIARCVCGFFFSINVTISIEYCSSRAGAWQQATEHTIIWKLHAK